jgi:predicted transglutaminase-like cysteine proteinase
MLPTSDHSHLAVRAFAASATGKAARAAAVCAGVALSCLLGMGAYSPAAADGYIQPKRPVVAPVGFAGVCERYDWACAGGTAGSGSDGLLTVARRVNAIVNGSVAEAEDDAQYGTDELWALPTARGGDCEDFALMKKHELILRGVPAGRLLIATVLDHDRQPHAVLVVRAEEGDYVLDNLTDRVVRWDRTGYSFIRIQDPRAPSRWAAVFAGGVFGTNSL